MHYKKEFPILEKKMNGKPLVYLDSASTTQKPDVVIDALRHYYKNTNANIHRGVYPLSEEATEMYEATRSTVAQFIGAHEPAEIIFTRNATEAINLVAYCYGDIAVKEGDNVVITLLEHHSNVVPWQELCRRKKAELRILPLLEDGTIEMENLNSFIDTQTKIVAFSQMSNVLGTILPLKELIHTAKKVGAITVVDGAQGLPHLGMNVKDAGCDFYAFSSHKMLGPTGVGVLYGRRELLEAMPPFLFGGDMIREVHQKSATWNDLPWKFEAGTPNIADVIAFRTALEYLEKIGFDTLLEHDTKLHTYARKKLSALPGLKFFGPSSPKGTSIVSFTLPSVHPHDIGSILSQEGVAIRTGHHCCQPLMEHLKIPATARMSFYIYNSEEDIDIAYEALKKVYSIFKI